MGFTREIIEEIVGSISEGRNEGYDARYKELANVFIAYPDKAWGFQEFGEDGVIVIGGGLATEEREEICKILSDLKVVLFLKGLKKKTFLKDNSLVQRVTFQGGTLDGWEWALGTGEWNKDRRECMSESDFNNQAGTIITSRKED